MKTTETTSDEELEAAFLDDPEFGLTLLHEEYEFRIAAFIKSNLYAVPLAQKAEAIAEVYCMTMLELSKQVKKPNFDWRKPLGIVFDIARKKAVDCVRRRTKLRCESIDAALGKIASELADTAVHGAWKLISEEERARFNRVLREAIDSRLTPKEAIVATCFVDHYEEFTPNKIFAPLARLVSSVTGKDESAMTVKKQWAKAKEKLQRELTKNGFKFLDIEE